MVYAPQRAVLTFSNGTEINPDTLTPNKNVVISENLLINKKAAGIVELKTIGKGLKPVINGTIQTFQATKYTLVLTDGTKVYLNANSQLTFPEIFSKTDRVVNLKGEGYFEVTKTSKHTKFFVKTNEQVVKVLGTKFNIKSYNKTSVQTILLEGSVSISPADKFFHSVIIKPNQQAILKNNGVQISKIEASKALAWKDGFFVFNGDNTLDMLSEIARWYSLELDTVNAGHLKEYYGKIPSNVNLGQLIELLNYSGVHVKVYKDDLGKRKLFIL
ncbi:FecR family protein [Pedobacter petrophilus]|uniref:FecR family protein n=1 Tax=Pedobacter petrophilus TaxID=1908241 RepID=UPI00363FBF8A